jgi:hypothetical protein
MGARVLAGIIFLAKPKFQASLFLAKEKNGFK